MFEQDFRFCLIEVHIVEYEHGSEAALRRFLDWYDGRSASRPSGSKVAIDPNAFPKAFARFQELMVAKSGHRFTDFHEGLAAVWESYKPRLRDEALELLSIATGIACLN